MVGTDDLLVEEFRTKSVEFISFYFKVLDWNLVKKKTLEWTIELIRMLEVFGERFILKMI
jgi:hypothetical protein